MAKKKIRIKVVFEGEQFFPNKGTLEKSQKLTEFYSSPVPIVKNWTDDEVFLGTHKETSHLSWIQLSLISDGKYQFNNKSSNNSLYVISYDKFSDFNSISISFKDNSIIIFGSITLTMNISSEFIDDTIKSGLLYLDELGFRPQHNSDIFVFKKYGEKWELEDAEAQEFRKGISSNYFMNRSKIEIL
jgi:hypothetical protein